jgi:predicted dehydrogenase
MEGPAWVAIEPGADPPRTAAVGLPNRRWDSDYLTVGKAIAENAVGEVRHFEPHFDRFRPEVRDRWREGAGPGSGIWYDLGPHLVDQALQLFGLPDRVTANLGRLRPGGKSDDWTHVVMDYPRMRVILHASMLVAGGSPRFIVHGDAGSLVKRLPDVQENQLLAGIAPGCQGWGQDPDALEIHDGARNLVRSPAVPGDQRRFYLKVVDNIASGIVNPSSSQAAVAVMACIEAAIMSARSGKSLDLPLTTAERDGYRPAFSLR